MAAVQNVAQHALHPLFIASIGGEGVPPEAVEALEKAQNALVSVEGILDALLDISKLESGRAAVSADRNCPMRRRPMKPRTA